MLLYHNSSLSHHFPSIQSLSLKSLQKIENSTVYLRIEIDEANTQQREVSTALAYITMYMGHGHCMEKRGGRGKREMNEDIIESKNKENKKRVNKHWEWSTFQRKSDLEIMGGYTKRRREREKEEMENNGTYPSSRK